MINLIKRKDLNYNIKDGWYCEIRKGSSPNGSKAKVGEVIYIAQNGYAIFAKGIPFALETKGTVLLALGFTSIT